MSCSCRVSVKREEMYKWHCVCLRINHNGHNITWMPFKGRIFVSFILPLFSELLFASLSLSLTILAALSLSLDLQLAIYTVSMISFLVNKIRSKYNRPIKGKGLFFVSFILNSSSFISCLLFIRIYAFLLNGTKKLEQWNQAERQEPYQRLTKIFLFDFNSQAGYQAVHFSPIFGWQF